MIDYLNISLFEILLNNIFISLISIDINLITFVLVFRETRKLFDVFIYAILTREYLNYKVQFHDFIRQFFVVKKKTKQSNTIATFDK